MNSSHCFRVIGFSNRCGHVQFCCTLKANCFTDGFSGPVVGLQIRRTDKVGTEAAFHALPEYMKWTEYWFQIEEYRIGRSIQRRIYIATDDPSVFAEAKEK